MPLRPGFDVQRFNHFGKEHFPGFVGLAITEVAEGLLKGELELRKVLLAPKEIHVAHFVIDGGISREGGDPRAGERAADGMLLPDEIAKNYLHLYRQNRSAWTWEVELRPWVERF